MSTVAELIRGAFRVLGVLASEETPTAAEQSDALEVLNDMLDSWAGERLLLYATLRTSHTLTPGLTPHTIGSSGTFNTTRPVRIDRASIVPAASLTTEEPIDILTDAEWQALQGKGQAGRPRSLWVESVHPLMKLHLYPVPDVADSLILYTWQQIGRFASTATSVDLPPGYARAIRYALAKELAPEYGVQMSAEALDTANEAKDAIKQLNHKPSVLRCDEAVVGRGAFNLITGRR